jgi:hypothetical protein
VYLIARENAAQQHSHARSCDAVVVGEAVTSRPNRADVRLR